MTEGSKKKKTIAQVYLPGRSRSLKEDEELVMDTSAYRLYYQLKVEDPCLSFDILHDGAGDSRAVEVGGDPVSAYIVTGTQAIHHRPNHLILMKLSNLSPMSAKDHASNEDEESDSESEEDLDRRPEVEAAKIRHTGAVNRLRVCQANGVCLAASWSDLGAVNVWDLSRPLSAVNDSAVMSEYTRSLESPDPIITFRGHKQEGFAIDWSPCGLATRFLATGDCSGGIHIWRPHQSHWIVSPTPLTGHSASVEDIQWSPSEATVFISCSVDGSLRVWDTRCASLSRAMITMEAAHDSDVNVISWSRAQTALVLSGSDDGVIRLWDLRMVYLHHPSGQAAASATPFAHSFSYHRKAITSLEWHSSDPSIFLATAEDDQTTLWDITLEQEAPTPDGGAVSDLPSQLLFIHTGQQEVKEAHWHPQVPGLVVNTALDGFNIFRTICV